MLKSILLPVETSGLYFQDYSVLNAQCLHISFAGKPIWGSSKTKKLKGFPNKWAVQKQKGERKGSKPSSGTQPEAGAVLLAQPWMGIACPWEFWEWITIAAPFHCWLLQLQQEKMQIYTRIWVSSR